MLPQKSPSDDEFRLVFDVGCHTGEDSEFYLKKGFHVVAVEANPFLCSELKQKFRDHIAGGRFLLIEKAIAEKEGNVTFFMNEKLAIWGTINAEFARRNAAHDAGSTEIDVPSVRFSTLLRQFGVPYFLKVDIEGSDLLCLESLLEFRDRPRFLSLEITHRRMFAPMMRLLCRLGYSQFQIVDQSTVPAQECPRPPREGLYVAHQFPPDASGLFGRELPDTWSGRAAVTREYYALVAVNRMLRLPMLNRISPRHTWYDMHAAL
jgi:FkbM family methyltransferase